MKIKVQVSKKHIKEGVRNSPCNCPIALALEENGLLDVDVNPENIFFSTFNLKQGYDFECKTPIKAALFIDNFDEKRLVKPFSFWLNATKY